VSARTYGIGLTLAALVVSFAVVLGLGSQVAVRVDPDPRSTTSAPAGSTTATAPAGRPSTLIVRLGGLTADRQELTPGVTVWREGSLPGGQGGAGKLCVQPPKDWRVDGPGWARVGSGDAAAYCLSLDGVHAGTVEIPMTRHS
jgi:hypothetical protein